MAYVHCMPARIAEMTHGMDNVVSGVIEVGGATIDFRTRGHIVKAVNRIYRGSSWKPARGDHVLIDGDLTAYSITVDHIEPERVEGDAPVASSPHLDAITATLPGHPPATTTLRVWNREAPMRIRFADFVSRMDDRGRLVEQILHATLADDGWRLALVARQGGLAATTSVDMPVLTILARAAGRPLLVGETASEADRRQQQEIRDQARTRQAERHAPADPPPFDDCPF